MRWLVERVRDRMQRGRALVGSVALAESTPAQRRAVEALLGRPPGAGRSLSVSLLAVDEVVRRSGLHPDGLGAAVVALAGPVVALDETRAESLKQWATALDPLTRLVEQRPVLSAWYELATTRGLIKRVCGSPGSAAAVAASAAGLLSRLPLAGLPLSQVAQEIGADAHTLDHGRPLATIVRSAIRHTWFAVPVERLSPAQLRRAEWDCVGIITDELSSTALVLNLPVAQGFSGLARLLDIARECGEPMVLTLRQFARHQVAFEPRSVFLCENPSVMLAAANVLGQACPPLVCVNGQPTAAVLRLITLLAEAGCPLRYHGDFDWGGIRIANLLWNRFAIRPWRYDTPSYLERLRRSSGALRGSAVAAAWDADLSATIGEHGVRVEEEAVLDDLLADLVAAS